MMAKRSTAVAAATIVLTARQSAILRAFEVLPADIARNFQRALFTAALPYVQTQGSRKAAGNRRVT
jgi:hypothetical protein